MFKNFIKHFLFIVTLTLVSCKNYLETENGNILKIIKEKNDRSLVIEGFSLIRKENFPFNISEFSFFNQDSTQYILYIENEAGSQYERIFERRVGDEFSYRGFNGKDTVFHFISPRKLPLFYYLLTRKYEDEIVVISGKYYLNANSCFDCEIAPRYNMNTYQKNFYYKNEDSLMKVKGDMDLPILPEDTVLDSKMLFISDFEI